MSTEAELLTCQGTRFAEADNCALCTNITILRFVQIVKTTYAQGAVFYSWLLPLPRMLCDSWSLFVG